MEKCFPSPSEFGAGRPFQTVQRWTFSCGAELAKVTLRRAKTRMTETASLTARGAASPTKGVLSTNLEWWPARLPDACPEDQRNA